MISVVCVSVTGVCLHPVSMLGVAVHVAGHAHRVAGHDVPRHGRLRLAGLLGPQALRSVGHQPCPAHGFFVCLFFKHLALLGYVGKLLRICH